MKTIPVVRAALGGLSGRRMQAIVISLVVLLSTAAATLGLGLVADSSAPFDHAFAAHHGADVTATVAGVSPAQLAAATHVAGVTASDGPFPESTVSVTAQVTPSIHISDGKAATGTPITVHQPLTLVGRASPSGPVDDLALTSGHWPTGPGQIVLSSAAGLDLGVGSQLTVTGVAGSPKLTVVGIATSVTGTAQGWVAPSEIAALEQAGAPAAAQMLYDFSAAGTTSAVNKDVSAITAALLRAGRMSAVQAIATGRAPRPGHGYGALRLLGRGPLGRLLPRPVTIGLAGPFARPARALVTLAAIACGVTAVIFGSGLSSSLDRVQADLSRTASEQVQVFLAGHDGPVIINGQTSAKLSVAQQESAVQAALKAQPGTQHYVAESDGQVSVPGLPGQLSLTGFGGDASWTGYAMIAGHWYSGPGQVDVNTAFLNDTGTKVGEQYTLASGGQHVTVQITGEVFDPAGGMPEMIGATSTLSAVDPGLSPHYLLELAPGTNVGSYVNTLGHTLGAGYEVSVNHGGGAELPAVVGLVATLTLVIAVVAGLGVLNTVVLQTRERVHDLGVFKAVGMTPRQTITMVISTVTGIGLAAGAIAIPAGVTLHQYVLPVMGHAVQTNLPPAVLNVYHAPELALLALSGLVIAVAGGLAPASWAARTRTAFTLRTE